MRSTASSWNPARDGDLAQPPEWLLDCAFAEENAAGFVLGALAPDEQLRFVQHIAWCPVCTTLLQETRTTAGYLPFLSPQAVPPPSAKAALLARIASEQVRVAATPPATAAKTAGLYDDLLNRPLDDAMASDIAPSKRPSAKRRFAWEVAAAPLAAVPLVFALAIVGGFALQTQNRLNDVRASAQILRSENDALKQQAILLDQPITDSMNLESANDVAGDKMGGALYMAQDPTAIRLDVWSMPTGTDGYEVYLETVNGKFQRIQAFQVDEKGEAQVNIDLGNPLDQYRAVHVVRAQGDGQTAFSDSSPRPSDLLWRDLTSNLGDRVGTEANLNAH